MRQLFMRAYFDRQVMGQLLLFVAQVSIFFCLPMNNQKAGRSSHPHNVCNIHAQQGNKGLYSNRFSLQFLTGASGGIFGLPQHMEPSPGSVADPSVALQLNLARVLSTGGSAREAVQIYSQLELQGSLEGQPLAWLSFAYALLQLNDSFGSERALMGALLCSPPALVSASQPLCQCPAAS